jgi:hypothetical protein
MYEIFVTKIGMVYRGPNKTQAEKVYEAYVLLSEVEADPAAGQSVTLSVEQKHDGPGSEMIVMREHIGFLEEKEINDRAEWNERISDI